MIECNSLYDILKNIMNNQLNLFPLHSISDCPPIYLGIYGLKDSQPISDCFDSHCTNFDQIEYEFSHQGMYGKLFIRFSLSTRY